MASRRSFDALYPPATLEEHKDLFLVGFFLSIGLSGTPTWATLGIALVLVLAVPFKAALFFAILTRFKFRSRTALLSSLSLANYSEFGLIVTSIGVGNGWIGNDWLIVVAISLSITFVLAAPLNAFAHNIYARFSDLLQRFETAKRLEWALPTTSAPSLATAGYTRREQSLEARKELLSPAKTGCISCQNNFANIFNTTSISLL